MNAKYKPQNNRKMYEMKKQVTVTEEEAYAIGVDAYLYFYPLVSMDITRMQFTNIEPGKELGKGPMNTFSNAPEYPPANFKGVVRPNFDTLDRKTTRLNSSHLGI